MSVSYGVGRAIFRAMIPGWAALGLSSIAMVREARRLTALPGAPQISFRYTRMLADIREITGRMKKERLVTAIPRNAAPSPYAMVEADLRRARRYWVQGTATYYDVSTGAEVTREASFYTNELHTMEQWEEEYREAVEEELYPGKETLISFQAKSILHQRGWRY